MSAHHLRELVRQRVHEQLYGRAPDEAGQGGAFGTEAQILGDGPFPKDYADYRHLMAFRKGILLALKFVEESYAQIHDPEPSPEPEGAADATRRDAGPAQRAG